MVSTTTGAPTPGRSVRMAHDATAIYVLASVPAIPAGTLPRQGPCIQFVVDPDARGYRSRVFSVAPDGTQWASAVGDGAAEAPWFGAVSEEEGHLTVEMAVPVEAMGPANRTTHTWRVNVVDHRPEATDSELVFTGESPTSPIALADAELPALDLVPYRQSELKARLGKVVEGYRALSELLDLDVLPDEFPGKQRAERALEALGERLVTTTRDAGSAAIGGDEAWALALADMERLEAAFSEAQSSTWMMGGYIVAHRQTSHPTWALAAETPMRKVFREAAGCAAQFADKIALTAARGEGESVQLVLVPLAGKLGDVKIQLPDKLDGPGGGIPGSALDLREVGYVRALKPAYPRPVDTEWWPDALLPYSPVSVPREQVRPVWLTVWVPRETEPGTYRGTIGLRPRGEHELSVELEVKVWGFSLPQRPACRTSFGMSPGPVARHYLGDGEELPPEVFRTWCGELLRHRVSPYLAAHYRPENRVPAQSPVEPWETNIAYCMERGLSSMLLSIMPGTPGGGGDYDETYKTQFAADTGPLCERLKVRGWLDTAFICAWDEPNPSCYAGVRAGHRLIKQTCPDIDVLQTVNQDHEPAELVGDVDIWCPITSLWNPDFYH